jgi:hypothetical protein
VLSIILYLEVGRARFRGPSDQRTADSSLTELADRKERTLRRFSEALAPEVGITNPAQDGAVERRIGLINERIRKHGFQIENGVFVPMD